MNGLAVIADLSSKFPFLPKKPSESGPGKFRRFGPWRASLANAGLGPHLGWSGSLELRLATKKSEIRKAQRLRYRVFFRRGRRRRRRGRGADSPRYLPLRQCLRSSSGDRSRGPESFWQGQAKGRRGLQAVAPGCRPSPFRLLQRPGVRHRTAAGAASQLTLPRTRPILRSRRLSRQEDHRDAVAGDLVLCQTSSHRCDDRLRES